jgi:hypothetical protein
MLLNLSLKRFFSNRSHTETIVRRVNGYEFSTYRIRELLKNGAGADVNDGGDVDWIQTTTPADVVLGFITIGNGGNAETVGEVYFPDARFFPPDPDGRYQEDINLAIGNFHLNEIHGYKFQDDNGNGVDDGEPRLSGWTFFLDDNTNDVLDMGEESITTDGNGEYWFTDLFLGTHVVREVGQMDWVQTSTGPAAIEVTTSGDVWVAYSGQETIDAGQTERVRADLAVGNFELNEIHGMKFLDMNDSGTREPDGVDGMPDTEDDEVGLEGWTIFIDANNNGELDGGELSDVTDENGEYWIMGVLPGTQRVREVQQKGFVQTTPLADIVVDMSGEIHTGVDIGNFEGAEIHGYKFHDINGNGSDDDEPRLSGWTIYIDTDNDGMLDMDERSTTTNENGEYWIDMLRTGTYKVCEEQQDHWTQTTDDPTDIVIDTSGQIVTGCVVRELPPERHLRL